MPLSLKFPWDDVWSDKSNSRNDTRSKVPIDLEGKSGAARWSTWNRREPPQHAISLASTVPSVSVEKILTVRYPRHPKFSTVSWATEETTNRYLSFPEWNALACSNFDSEHKLHSYWMHQMHSVRRRVFSDSVSHNWTNRWPSAEEQTIVVRSDTASIDTTAAVVFGPVVKTKNAREKQKAAARALGAAHLDDIWLD